MWMLYLDIAIIAGEIAALVLSIQKHGFWKQFQFYTQWSNFILMAVTVAHLICLIRQRKIQGKQIPARVEKCLYCATCMTTVTLLVTVCVLIPWYGHPEYFMLETNGLFHHLLCPVLAIASLPFLRRMGKQESRIALIPTLLYGIVMYILNYLRLADGPYPFLKVHDQPWYMSVLWFLVLLGAACGVAAGLRKLCGRKS
jgi:hypothetical protein